MKSINLNLFIIACGLLSCANEIPEQGHESHESEVLSTGQVDSFVLADSSLYSENFLFNLYSIHHASCELKDSFLILDKKDTILFPSVPEIGKSFTLTAKKGEYAIALHLQRINYTTINYSLEMIEFGNASYQEEGQAYLQADFYLNASSDPSENAMGATTQTEFSSFQENNCYVYIQLAYKDSMHSQLLGKLIKNCNGKLDEITLDNFPTFIEK